ncbi:MAG TPA: T9SS type A sorting domain-containing protein, partial [Chitinophagales bacterium]|nr:T9SS type A sorting domain-containing protein [Chitinophagales bacterium]
TNDALIYPNPTSDLLNIQLKENIGAIDFSILDSEGNYILKTKANKIDQYNYTLSIGQLAKGNYQLKIDNENYSGSFKIQKQ